MNYILRHCNHVTKSGDNCTRTKETRKIIGLFSLVIDPFMAIFSFAQFSSAGRCHQQEEYDLIHRLYSVTS